jgi:putative polyhydroxyalkanoate system protein
MHLNLTRKYHDSDEHMRERLAVVERRLHEKYGARTQWTDATTMTIGAPGVRGELHLRDGELAVDLDLSVVLSPLRARIEQQLRKELEAVIPD